MMSCRALPTVLAAMWDEEITYTAEIINYDGVRLCKLICSASLYCNIPFSYTKSSKNWEVESTVT